MPFVNEKISDEDKARINWKEFKFWPGDQNGLMHPNKWTIDRDKDLFFVQLETGRPDGPPPTYGFSWRGSFVRVSTSATSEWQQKESGIWEVIKIDLPPNLETERSEIIKELRSAIRAFGWNYSGGDIKAIKITNEGKIPS